MALKTLLSAFVFGFAAARDLHFPPSCGGSHPIFIQCCEALASSYNGSCTTFKCNETAATGVTELQLEGCGFSGQLPTTPLKNFVNLTFLSLRQNSFTGPLNDLFTALPLLKRVDFQENQLEGFAGQGIVNCKQIEIVDFSFNQFQRLSPDVFALKTLKELHVQNNQIQEIMGNDAGDMISLVHMDISNNKFKGIPAKWQMKNLISIFAQNNEITGPFPEFGQDLNMKMIAFNDNNFYGTVPSSYGKEGKKKLLVLQLGGNRNISCPVLDYSNFANFTDFVEVYGAAGTQNCTTHVTPNLPSGGESGKSSKLDGVEIFLIILLIVFVCGLGFYCYRQHNDPSKYVQIAEDGTL